MGRYVSCLLGGRFVWFGRTWTLAVLVPLAWPVSFCWCVSSLTRDFVGAKLQGYVKNCDLARRRVLVVDNAVMVGTTVVVGTPKSHKSRSVPIPAFLNSELERLTRGKPDTAYLFGTGEAPVRLPNSKDGWFASAVRRAQKIDETFPRVTPHDLRHSAASLAVSAGANVKAVQRMLGHASAAMTLDVYSDLFDDDLDAVADRLDRARSDSNVGKMWAEGLSSE